MRKLFVLLLFLLSGSLISFSQTIVKEHYTVSGGLLGAMDFNKFRVTGSVPDKYDTRPGWTAGAWVNFPISKRFSFEPQLTFSQLQYESQDVGTLLRDGKIGYLSLPLQLKLHLGDVFAIVAGPQVNFTTSVKDENSIVDKDAFKSTSLSAFGGVEINPHGRLVLFGRYFHGITNMDNTNSTRDAKYFNQNIQAGLKFKLFGKLIPADSDGDGIPDPKDKCPNQAGLARYEGCPIPDRDGDGINDEVDKCPDQPGLEKYAGCPIPDTDKDGVNDENDKCPNEVGLPKYNGCPIPDTDGDGINDEEDKCPNEKGLAKYNGCPIPDSDGDGINDEEDRCPTVAGVAAMLGCPAVENFQANEVTFASGKAVLTAAGKKELDLLVDYMQKYNTVSAKLTGYTDNTGTDKINLPLSQKRAEAAKAYLVSKGIEEGRITTEGLGSANPVGDNKTSKGKALNRRVEMSVQ